MKFDFLHDDEDAEHVPFRKMKKTLQPKQRHQRYDDEGRRERTGTKQNKPKRGREDQMQQGW